ncbi:MAG TPA: hypothetical protein VM888_12705, partial [Chitinophagaceae bacterium]|nr:hypothetical protein [Chitinophagaceae bacterium]
ISDWQSGSLNKYDTQLSERIKLLEESKGSKSLQIKELSNIPRSIVDEHGKDVEINIRNYQQYFKIDTVKIY